MDARYPAAGEPPCDLPKGWDIVRAPTIRLHFEPLPVYDISINTGLTVGAEGGLCAFCLTDFDGKRSDIKRASAWSS